MTDLKRFSFFSILFFLGCFSVLHAQTGSLSPYSRYGIGDLSTEGFTYQTAMGGAGSALGSSFIINYLNPASYVYDTTTIFEFGFRAELSSFATSSQSTSASSANFSHFCLAFPVIKTHWSAALGLAPVSSVGYDLNLFENIQNVGVVKNVYTGTGGLSKVFMGNSFKIAKGLTAGVNISYLFGTIENLKAVEFPYGSNYYNSKYINSVTVNDFYFNYGLMYQFDLPKNKRLSIGIAGAPDTKTNATNYLTYYNYTKISGYEVIKDSIIKDGKVRGNIILPANYRLGATLSSPTNWSASLDLSMQQWEHFENFGATDSLVNSYAIQGGGEYRLNKMILRAGGHYRKNYLELRNTPINEYGVSVGMGVIKLFPKRPSSTINIAFEYVHRGTKENNLLNENYFRIHLGLTLTDIWFIKNQYD